MSQYCCVCRANKYNSKQQIVFHSFPSDPVTREIWLKVLKQGNATNRRVCSQHFTPNDYRELCSKRLLKNGAVPSINIPILDRDIQLLNSNEQNSEQCTTPMESRKETKDINASDSMENIPTERVISTDSVLSLKRTNHSCDESTTPTKLRCYMQEFGLLRKEDFTSNTSWNRFVRAYDNLKKENKLLQHKNERLLNKIQTLHDLIEVLKSKELVTESTATILCVNKDGAESSNEDDSNSTEIFSNQEKVACKYEDEEKTSKIPKNKKIRGMGRKRILCSSCSKRFPTTTSLRLHLRTHGIVEKKLSCIECGKKYTNQYDLTVHLRKHSGVRPFACKVCQKSFADRRCFEKHKKIHSGEKLFKCELCDKSFIHSYTLKTHLRTHNGEKPYVCAKCGHSFTTATQLKLHTRVHHTQEKPYMCNLCPKTFTSGSGLSNHKMTHTGERKFICSICGKGSRTSSDLKCHLRTHTGERPFECKFPDCDKKYKTNSQLCTHLRSHTGEKNHQCALCSKSFSGASQLKTHMRVHTGQKPYICSICDYKFSQSGSLNTHLKMHYKNNCSN